MSSKAFYFTLRTRRRTTVQMGDGFLPLPTADPHQAPPRCCVTARATGTCEHIVRSPALTPPGGRPVFGTAAATSLSCGEGTGSAAPRAQDRVSFAGASSPHWGCEPRSGVVPPTRELCDGMTVPHAHNDTMSAVVEGPRSAGDRQRPAVSASGLSMLLVGQGSCQVPIPRHVLALLAWCVLDLRRRARMSSNAAIKCTSGAGADSAKIRRHVGTLAAAQTPAEKDKQ